MPGLDVSAFHGFAPMVSRIFCLLLGLAAAHGAAAQNLVDLTEQTLVGQTPPAKAAGGHAVWSRKPPRLEVIAADEWQRIDTSVERALEWLATQQLPDGSFETKLSGQPAVTSLCVLAYLSAGHVPGQGKYGDRLNRAIDFVLTTQRADGLFSLEECTQPADEWNEATQTATYNHAIAGVMLAEAYGLTPGARDEQIRPAIERGLSYTRRLQTRRKISPIDEWGWRYIRDIPTSSGDGGGDADLSVTSWHLMFLRAARNAGFDVPASQVNEALDYVRRCYQPHDGSFSYALYANGRMPTRAMTGAGVLCLFLSGRYDPQIEVAAGRWILAHPFAVYNQTMIHDGDRYFYSAYYCSQAMYQLGGDYWEQFYPPLASVLLANQRPDGGWEVESADPLFGETYSTSLAVLSLTPPYQLLPIYQR
jgi:hypothetical protein